MTRLRLATRVQDTFENAFAQQIADFRRLRPDVEIEVVTSPIHDHYERFVANDGLSSGDIDLFLCCTDWLPEAIDKGQLKPLDDLLKTQPPQDWPTGWHAAMRGLQEVQGKTYGLPWHDGPEVFHYRRDLFEDAAERGRFEARFGRTLEPPKTWAEFLEVARFFTRPEQGLWGCCEGAYTDGHNNVYDFLIHLWSRGGVLFDEGFRPRFHETSGVEALQYYADLFHRHRVAPPECLTMGSVECGDYYASGKAAMMWNWCGFAAVCEMPQYSQIVGRNACTRLPAGDGPTGRSVSLNIYWVLTIPSAAAHSDAAYAFLRHVAQPHTDKMTSMAGANGVRLSTWHDPEVLVRYPYYGIIEEVHGGTITLPAIPEYPPINEAISRAVHAVIHDGEPVEPSLRHAATEATQILRNSGRLKE